MLKAFYTWLRTVKFMLEPEGDPLLNRLKTPKTGVAQHFGEPDTTKVNDLPSVWRVIDYFEQLPYHRNQHDEGSVGGHRWKADVLRFHLRVPWHSEEMWRFMDPAEPDSRIIVPGDRAWKEIWRKVDPETAAVVSVMGKRKVVRNKITSEDLEVARRLREHGKVGDPEGFKRELNAVCDELDISRVHLGWFRHTYLTAHVDEGGPIDDAARAASHSSTRTTEVYTESAVKKRPKAAPLRLVDGSSS